MYNSLQPIYFLFCQSFHLGRGNVSKDKLVALGESYGVAKCRQVSFLSDIVNSPCCVYGNGGQHIKGYAIKYLTLVKRIKFLTIKFIQLIFG